MNTITVLDVVNEAIALAEASPEFVYDSNGGCYYTPTDTQPVGCIYGQAMLRLGVTPATLRHFQETQDHYGVLHLLEWLGITVPPRAGRAIATAQDRQDMGFRWGEVPLIHLRRAQDLLTEDVTAPSQTV